MSEEDQSACHSDELTTSTFSFNASPVPNSVSFVELREAPESVKFVAGSSNLASRAQPEEPDFNIKTFSYYNKEMKLHTKFSLEAFFGSP